MSFADGSGSLRSVFRKHRRVPGRTEGLFGIQRAVLHCGLRSVTVFSTLQGRQVRRVCQGKSGAALTSSGGNRFQSFGNISVIFPFSDSAKVTLI